jgi:histidinol-phosphate aminotransferase
MSVRARAGRGIRSRKAVEEMRAYHPPLEGRGGKLRLDFNENTSGCSPAVRSALRRMTSATVSMYPEQETVRARLAKYFRVVPEELLLTNGTDDALHLVTDTFVERGDEVLIVEPTFAMYRFYSELAGARITALRYNATMQFPMSALFKALKRGPRVFFVANPNNPTGHVLNAAELRKILRVAARTVVVIDEAYFEYCGVSAIGWIRQLPNLIVTRTFSKAAGMAGLRLGCIFTNRDNAAVMRKAASPYPVNAAALTAAYACATDKAYLRETIREFRKSRAELIAGLKKLGVEQFPSAANFILTNMGERAKDVVRGLSQRGILVRDRSSDFGGLGYVRITIGTVAQTRRVLGALKEVL